MWGVGPFVLSSKAVLSIKGELGGGRAEDSRRNFAFHPLSLLLYEKEDVCLELLSTLRRR